LRDGVTTHTESGQYAGGARTVDRSFGEEAAALARKTIQIVWRLRRIFRRHASSRCDMAEAEYAEVASATQRRTKS
jgi:hypothetical protein